MTTTMRRTTTLLPMAPLSTTPATTALPAGVPRDRSDHRSGPRTRALVLAAGGLLFALGNLLHPLEHSDHAETSPTRALAHLTFASGGLLVAAGLGAVTRPLRFSRAGLVGAAMTWSGMVLLAPSAYVEAFVAPLVDHETSGAVETAGAAVGVLTAVCLLAGPGLMTVMAARHRVIPWWCAALVVLALVVTAAGAGLPVIGGYAIIGGTALLGVSLSLVAGVVRTG